MKRREFLKLSALGVAGIAGAGAPFQAHAQTTRKILIAGGGFGTGFIRYMASLTGVRRPKLLYLPTASADGQMGIINWYKSCAPLEASITALPLTAARVFESARRSNGP